MTRKIAVIGHADHGKTTLTAAIETIMRQEESKPFIIMAEPLRPKRIIDENYSALLAEYDLISLKKSKLSRKKRDEVVRKVSQLYKNGKL